MRMRPTLATLLFVTSYQSVAYAADTQQQCYMVSPQSQQHK